MRESLNLRYALKQSVSELWLDAVHVGGGGGCLAFAGKFCTCPRAVIFGTIRLWIYLEISIHEPGDLFIQTVADAENIGFVHSADGAHMPGYGGGHKGVGTSLQGGLLLEIHIDAEGPEAGRRAAGYADA